MIKTDAGRVQTQMYVQIAAAFSALCEPFYHLQQLNYQEY
jgi:hypothetical protein